MAFSCVGCGAPISAGQIDFAKKIAACSSCGSVGPLDATVGVGPVARMPPELPWEEHISQGVATFHVRNPSARGTTWATAAFVLALLGGCGFARFAWTPFLVVLAVALPIAARAYRELTASTTLRLTVKGLAAKRLPSGETLELASPPVKFHGEAGPAESDFVPADGDIGFVTFERDPYEDELNRGSVVSRVPRRAARWWTVRVETADGSVRALPIRLENEQLAHHAAARLNEVITLLSSADVGGYRVAPSVVPAPLLSEIDEEAARRGGA